MDAIEKLDRLSKQRAAKTAALRSWGFHAVARFSGRDGGRCCYREHATRGEARACQRGQSSRIVRVSCAASEVR